MLAFRTLGLQTEEHVRERMPGYPTCSASLGSARGQARNTKA
jgi:hypothetical protein